MKNNTIVVNCTTDKPHEMMELEVIVTDNSGDKSKGNLMVKNSSHSLNDLAFTNMIDGDEYKYSAKIVGSTNKHCSVWNGTFTYQGSC